MASIASAQDADEKNPHARWEKSIAAFEASDKTKPPPKNSFLFVGSSSIRLWKLDESFPSIGSINRGFGGSQIENSTHFADRIIIPHRPHTVLLYAGDNDINKGKDAARVVADYQAFAAKLKTGLPKVHIGYIAIKPSIARLKLWPEMNKANDAIAAICATDPNMTFLDIGKVMLDPDRKPKSELLLEDGLHCNEAGYAAWCEVIRPFIQSRQKALANTKARP